MTTRTDLIARLREFGPCIAQDVQDALESLEQQVAALTKELDEDALLQPRITMSNLEMASALAAAQAREAKLREEVNNALKWAVPTSPCHHHLTMGISIPADDTALMERLKQERECVYVEMFNQGYINKQSLQQLQGA